MDTNISIRIYAEESYLGTSILGYQDGMLSHIFGMKIESKLLPNSILECRSASDCFLLKVEFED